MPATATSTNAKGGAKIVLAALPAPLDAEVAVDVL